MEAEGTGGARIGDLPGPPGERGLGPSGVVGGPSVSFPEEGGKSCSGGPSVRLVVGVARRPREMDQAVLREGRPRRSGSSSAQAADYDSHRPPRQAAPARCCSRARPQGRSAGQGRPSSAVAAALRTGVPVAAAARATGMR